MRNDAARTWTPKRKKSMTTLDYHLVLSSLWRDIEGARVKNVYANKGIYELRLASNEFSIYLWPPHGFFLYKGRLATYGQESPLLKEIRSVAKGRIITAMYQLNFDRVIAIEFGDDALIYEGVREGNIVIASSKIIVAALNERKMRDRSTTRGAVYIPPPPPKIDMFSLTLKDLLKLSESARRARPIIVRLIRELSVPAEIASEALHRSGIDLNRAEALGEDECIKFLRNMQDIIKESFENKGCYKAILGNEVFGVYPFKPHLLESLGAKIVNEESFSLALGEYFIRLFEEGLKEEKDKIAPQIKATIERYLNEASNLRRMGAMLLSNIDYLENLRMKAMELRSSGASAEKIIEALSGEYPIIGVDELRKEVTVKIEDQIFKIKLEESVGKQASEIFSRAKKLEEKAEKAREVMKKRLEQGKKEYPKKVFKAVKKRAWYTSFRYFFSSEGFLVVGGKDASQNEALVRKYLAPQDIFLHADIHGGPAVIVKTEGRTPGEKTIYEAAQLAAVFSRAWEAGFASIDVYWVYGSQVSKKAPSGEYLSRGAFMVYGKRNYLRNTPLEWSIGLKIEDDRCELICAPPSVVLERCDFWAVLVPGRLRREFVIRKLVRHFKESAGKKGIRVKLVAEEILMCLPKGGIYISRWGKRV